MPTIVRIPATGSPVLVTAPEAPSQQLSFFQQQVDGYVEAVGTSFPDTQLYVDEDGIANGRSRNSNTEALDALGLTLIEGDYIKGTAVVISYDDEGDIIDVNPDVLEALGLR